MSAQKYIKKGMSNDQKTSKGEKKYRIAGAENATRFHLKHFLARERNDYRLQPRCI